MKYALVIANNEYDDTRFPKLSAPTIDAEEFARVLQDKEIGAFDEVKVIINEHNYNIQKEIAKLYLQKKSEDLVLLYFSGHGVKDINGGLYLSVKNTDKDLLQATAIQDYYIIREMDQSYSKKQIVILDCCNSGAFAQGTKAVIGENAGWANALQGKGYGRVILAATDSIQYAWEGDKILGESVKTSLFTHFLIQGLQGKADTDYDGRITVNDLFDYASDQVISNYPNQTPVKSTSKEKGQIVLREKKRALNTKYPLFPDDLIDSIESYFVPDRQKAIKQLTELLQSTDVQLQKQARKALEDMAKTDDSNNVRLSATQVLGFRYEAEQKIVEEHRKHEEIERKLREEQKEAQHLVALKAEQERIAHEKAEVERKAKEKIEKERKEKEEQDRIAAWLAENKRIAHEKIEAERKAKEKAEKERKEKEERERIAAWHANNERLARKKSDVEHKEKEEKRVRQEQVATREANRIESWHDESKAREENQKNAAWNSKYERVIDDKEATALINTQKTINEQKRLEQDKRESQKINEIIGNIKGAKMFLSSGIILNACLGVLLLIPTGGFTTETIISAFLYIGTAVSMYFIWNKKGGAVLIAMACIIFNYIFIFKLDASPVITNIAMLCGSGGATTELIFLFGILIGWEKIEENLGNKKTF